MSKELAEDLDEAIEDFQERENLGHGFTHVDPLEEIEIGKGDRSRPTFVSENLLADYKKQLIELLKEYSDFFAWEYHEIPGLSRDIVEHRLDIRPDYRPFKQPPRRFNAQIYPKIEEEIERLLEAKFIRPCRYAE